MCAVAGRPDCQIEVVLPRGEHRCLHVAGGRGLGHQGPFVVTHGAAKLALKVVPCCVAVSHAGVDRRAQMNSSLDTRSIFVLV
jgi:hypothetical protein